MSGLLRLASYRAFAPVGIALRGGPAARPASGTPPLALLLSGGLHFLALALFLAAAARTDFEEVRQIEMRVTFDPGIILEPPPSPVAKVRAGGSIDPRGRIEPVAPEDPILTEPFEGLFGVPGPSDGVRPDAPPAVGGGGGFPPSGQNVVADLDVPTEEYDQPPAPIVAPEPPYPDIAREAGIEGRVVLEALVGRDGHVREVRLREGNRMLADPAAKTVGTWRFRPARWRGQAVTAWVSIPIVFRLH